MKFNLIIIMYNLNCHKSPIVNSLLEIYRNSNLSHIRVFICDNSTKVDIKIKNKEYCGEKEFVYVDMNGNKGLSKAYNKAIELINEKEWIVLFDQDTLIVDNYFLELEKSITRNKHVSIHVPIIKSEDIIISPCLLKKMKVKQFRVEVNKNYSDITAINTGMCINKRVFSKTGGYNEDIFLDYLDHYFMREYYKYYKEVAVINATLIQSFSGHDNSSFETSLLRFKIFLNDFFVYCCEAGGGKIYYSRKILLRAIKLSFIYKNIAFLKMVLKR
ncbi:glycosyltransferase [Alkalibacter saccharofermentans]|uniref:Glycosyltransferase, GT2 family n=1 Tax=Alkalibacter saccharofermentans DSM 14828 TaxID=1120975 RepID=A0A1M4WPI8_9FIRM|nr:glycosyltransferase [Alkalibacter saccharofermentans]SHE83080.1 Glycosyltransferase, GT2 family [Alkalibacter saccharofermentans DSM 14828]